MTRNTISFRALSLAALLMAMPLIALGQDVLPGMDLFQTDPGNTGFCFCDHPIPAGFFGPGSDPFDQPVHFEGFPPLGTTLCPGNDLSGIDTIVERLGTATLPEIGSSDTIPIEIVELQLRNADPIEVTYNGGQNPEFWDLMVTLTPSAPSLGLMTLTKTHAGGGVADIELMYFPGFNFSLGPLNLHHELPSALEMIATDIPWVYETAPDGSCTSNFCLNPGNLTALSNTSAGLGWLVYCPSPPVAVEGVHWGQVKSLY